MLFDIKKFPKLVGYFVFYDFYEFSTTIHNLGYTHFVLRWG